MRTPAGLLLFAFVVGLLLHASLWWCLLLVPFFSVMIRAHWPVSQRTLLVCVLLLGVFRGVLDKQPSSLETQLQDAPMLIQVRAKTVSDFVLSRYGTQQKGWLQLQALEQQGVWVPCTDRVYTTLPLWDHVYGYGECIQALGWLRAGQEKHHWDEAQWLWVQGAVGIFQAKSAQAVEATSPRGSLWVSLRQQVHQVRWQLRQWGRAWVPYKARAYLKALLLGQRQHIDPEVKAQFVRSGTLHVLAVSGFHVGLLASVFLLGLSALRLPYKTRYITLSVLLVLYCLLVGPRWPILRATSVGILFCAARCLGKPMHWLHWTCWVALVSLWVHPRALYDVSFQLSFIAVFGILLLSPRCLAFAKRRLKYRAQRWHFVLVPLAVSCSAWVATAPVVAWHFGQLSVWGPIANLVVVPWIALMVCTGLVFYLSAALGGLGVGLWSSSFMLQVRILEAILGLF